MTDNIFTGYLKQTLFETADEQMHFIAEECHGTVTFTGLLYGFQVQPADHLMNKIKLLTANYFGAPRVQRRAMVSITQGTDKPQNNRATAIVET